VLEVGCTEVLPFSDLVFIDIHAQHGMPHFSEAYAGYQASQSVPKIAIFMGLFFYIANASAIG
jgi:hypothetical protein